MKTSQTTIFTFLTLLFTVISTNAFAQNIPDGIYLFKGVPGQSDSVWTTVPCSQHYMELQDSPVEEVLIDASDYVPLILQNQVDTIPQGENKKMLVLSLRHDAGEKLASFTSEHLGKRTALIIGGEVISMHAIKAVLTGGTFQISWCGPDVCEVLMVKLAANIAKQ